MQGGPLSGHDAVALCCVNGVEICIKYFRGWNDSQKDALLRCRKNSFQTRLLLSFILTPLLHNSKISKYVGRPLGKIRLQSRLLANRSADDGARTEVAVLRVSM